MPVSNILESIWINCYQPHPIRPWVLKPDCCDGMLDTQTTQDIIWHTHSFCPAWIFPCACAGQQSLLQSQKSCVQQIGPSQSTVEVTGMTFTTDTIVWAWMNYQPAPAIRANHLYTDQSSEFQRQGLSRTTLLLRLQLSMEIGAFISDWYNGLRSINGLV